MEKYQSVYSSKTVWGIASAVIGATLSAIGIDNISAGEIENFGRVAFELGTKALEFGGLCLALYGRIRATRQVVIALPQNVPLVVVQPPPEPKSKKRQAREGD